jgi:NAD(P)-dependent dehydrogenase (short-subunit alcohol dehydrogenase family)
MNTHLQGHVAVITGACSGLGLAIAGKLSTLGATLVMVDRNKAEIEKTQLLINR